MINSIYDGAGLSGAGSLYSAQQLQGSSSAVGSLAGGQGASGVAPTSATISGPGQLLSDLQQLQTQDPTKFQQVVSQIATQLQSAAQQAQGPQSTFLSNLAAKFQSVAGGGSLSQLQPQQHHHHHHAQHADSQGGQSPPQGIAALLQSNGSPSVSGSTLQQPFTAASALQAYAQNSQSQPQGIAGLAQASAGQATSSSTLQQLFASISTEVSKALAG